MTKNVEQKNVMSDTNDKRIPLILEMRKEGMTYKQIAEAFNRSPESIRQILVKHELKLKRQEFFETLRAKTRQTNDLHSELKIP